MKNSIYIILVLFCAFSCINNNTKKKKNDIPKYVINELNVINNSHLKQIKTIISNTDCFEMHKQKRNVIVLIYKSSEKLVVALSPDIAYDENDLKREYGGFYEKIDDVSFLFVISKTDYIPSEMYKLTGKTINVRKYIGLPNEISDAVWYLKNENNKLEFVTISCW